MSDVIKYPKRGDYAAKFNELIDLATRDRMRSSGVGVFMSGGLDSTTGGGGRAKGTLGAV